MDESRYNTEDLPRIQESRINHKAGRFICLTCSKRFTKPSLLRRHEAMHLPDKPFECSECHKRFSQDSSLRRHYLEKHDLNLKRFQCTKCPLSFTQKSNLRLHAEKVHPSKILRHTESYACDRCPSVYGNKQKLSRHINLVHKDGNKSKNAFDKIEEDDDLALTQSVLEQLKTFQMEMSSLQAPVLEVEENLDVTNMNVLDNPRNFIEVATQQQEERIIDEVQLKDCLNAQGVECYLSVQRTVRKDGCAVYICEFCGKEFRKSYDYIRHRRVHTNERPYNCGLCERAFSTKSKLHEHMKIHSLDEQQGIPAKYYPCSVCNKGFSSLQLLDKHMSTHEQMYQVAYKCKICEKMFKSSIALTYHKHKQVDSDSKFLQQLLPTPTEIYANSTESSCEIPDSSAAACPPETTNISQHLKRKRVVYKWKCITCERHFSNSSTLRDHRRIYHGTYNRKRRISASASLRCFKCSYCARVFETKARSRTHMLTHLKRLLNTDKSNQEPNVTNIINSLVFVTSLTNPASVKVIEFNVITKRRATNMQHINQKHVKNSSQLLKCHICKDQFRKQSDLKRHLVVHTGERLHKCATCDKSFSLSSTLKQHMLTHTTERAKHICIVCTKTYLTKKALNVHLRLHTGAQPFQCEHCELEFRTSGQRIAHLKVKHGILKLKSTNKR
ncbi:zinc finger protein 107-like isoform X1 [Bactrocera tryoni]|uniref:zinc finger protein 107-like isoform X1 n=2 Tax=Bactrocera tryoni TaxID=59916 RepID=UPI001A965A1A|nr:zinc finger protein 107-like isoform X1 [Bactrocera tryoni]